jgi:hypothetical protein
MEIAAQERHRLGLTAWIYVGLSIAVIGMAAAPVVMRAKPDVSPWIGWLLLVTTVAPVISAAAFHARHPGAWRSARTIAIAFAVLAFATVIGVVSGIQVAIGELKGSYDQVSGGNTLGGAAVIPQVVGGALLWAGLRRARRRPSRRGGWVLVGGVWIVVGIELALVSLLAAWYVALGGDGWLFGLLVLILIGPSVVVQGLLATVLWRGARAGEQPNAAWWIGGIGWAMVLVATPVFVATQEAGSAGMAVAGACMVAAFALGLPAIDGRRSEASGPLELASVG